MPMEEKQNKAREDRRKSWGCVGGVYDLYQRIIKKSKNKNCHLGK
jgi:hypothetical protein